MILYQRKTFRHRILSLLVVVTAIRQSSSVERRNLLDDLKSILNPDKQHFLSMGESLLFNDNLTAECTTSLLRTGRALQTGKMWAIKMIASSGLIPENLFLGQTQAHGSLDQCIGKPISIQASEDDDVSVDQQNQYCKIRIMFESNMTAYQDLATEIHKSSGLSVQEIPGSIKGIYTGLVISLCLPRDCSKSDLAVAFDMVKETYGINSEVSSCQTDEVEPVELKQIFVLLLLFSILLLSIIGLIVESKQSMFRKSFMGRFLRCFALNANLTSLLEAGNRESPTAFLNGLKLLLCLWISAGHLIIFPSPEFTYNPGAFFNVVSRSLWFQLFSNINLAVVGFFFISGFLIHNGTKRFSTKSPLSYILISFVRRYLKLVVPAFIVLLTTFLYPLMSRTTSPRGGFYFNNVGSCSEEWYLLLCLSNNFIDIFREQCLTHLWYISTDLKVYPVIVALSVLYRKHPKYSKMLSLGIVITTSIFVGIETYVVGASGVVARADLEGKRYMAAGMALDIYTRPYTQIAAYIMGFLCAVIVESGSEQLKKLTSFSNIMLWILSAALFATQAIFITYSTIQVFSPAGIGMSIYSGLSRPLHALVYMWLVTTCALKLAVPLSRALSHPILHVLGKLSYGVYLIHFPLASLMYANLKIPSLQYDILLLSQYVCGNLTQSFMLAVLLYVLVEKPIANLDKMFITRNKRSTNNLNLTTSVTAQHSQEQDIQTTSSAFQKTSPASQQDTSRM